MWSAIKFDSVFHWIVYCIVYFPILQKRCIKDSEDVFQHALPQDFIEKQQAYFKEIDDFELPVEEVESVAELD